MEAQILTPFILTQLIQPIISTSSLWESKRLDITLIANPAAGGFTRKKVSSSNLKVLKEVSLKSRMLPNKSSVIRIKLDETKKPGQATEIVHHLLERISKSKTTDMNYLVITAGGDGTHLEAQTAIAKFSFRSKENANLVKNKLTILRLPFGTGNDGSDGREFSDTLKLLTEPAHFEIQKAIKVWYEGKEPNDAKTTRKKKTYDTLEVNAPWYAFNIASIGIDAFITYMTNKTKKIFPGDSYQMWVDLACVFYNFKFPSKPLTVELFDEHNNLIGSAETAIEFVLLGVSGFRTYGSNHKILPDTRNFCLAQKIGLFTKLKSKSQFNDGSHVKNKFCILGNANKIKITYNQDILVQMDGEVHMLQPSYYPLYMQVTEPVIPVIVADDSTINKGTVLI